MRIDRSCGRGKRDRLLRILGEVVKSYVMVNNMFEISL